MYISDVGNYGQKDADAIYGLHPLFKDAASSATQNVPKPYTPLTDRIANNEAMVLSFIAENSLSFAFADDLVELAKALAKDKKLSRNFSCQIIQTFLHFSLLCVKKKKNHRFVAIQFSLTVERWRHYLLTN